jgi:hypothetical protein
VLPVVRPNDPPLAVQGLAQGVAGGAGVENTARVGAEVQQAADDYYKAKTFPMRTFVYLPVLPAGQEVRVGMLMPGLFNSKIDPPTYSLYSDEGSRDNQVVGGIEEVRAQVAKNRSQPPPRPGNAGQPSGPVGTRPPAPARPQPAPAGGPGSADRFAQGSVWRSTNNRGGPLEVIVLERDGDNFRAEMRGNGRHLRNIEGTVANGKITWQGAAGESNPGGYNVGVIKDNSIQVRWFSSPNSTVPRGAFTLTLVP